MWYNEYNGDAMTGSLPQELEIKHQKKSSMIYGMLYAEFNG